MKKQLTLIFFVFAISIVSLTQTYQPASAAGEPTITPLAQWGDYVLDVELVGDTIFVTNMHNLVSLELSGSSLIEKGRYSDTDGCHYLAISEEDNKISAVSFSSYCQYPSQLKLFEVSNPSSPSPIGTHNVIGVGSANVLRYGGKSYVLDRQDGLVVITTVGEQNPPTYLPQELNHQLRDIDIVGETAYVVDLAYNRLHILNIANNTISPLSILNLGFPGNPNAIDVEGDYAYIAAQFGLKIVDISDPLNPNQVSQFDAFGSHVSDVKVKNGYAFLANDVDGVEIVDVSDPRFPKSVAHADTPGNAFRIDVDDENMYVADLFGGLQIFKYENLPLQESAPAPFLELPWNYQGKVFDEAANSMFSFFDHEYPLLSARQSLAEQADASNTIINYHNPLRVDRPYSSHDGYDWGRKAGLKLSDPVLAAAGGCAKKMYCTDCGNSILIDHGNHYQTRYYHLQSNNLVTQSTTQCVNVTKGQQVGLVGLTGHTTGAHIHFMVVEDKNRDGDFEDNIPDGITDPFGWQSDVLDPWPSYNFFYKGQNRTGNNSHYLWLHLLQSLREEVTGSGVILDFENTKVAFPPNTVSEPAIVTIKKTPWARISNEIEAIRTGVSIIVKDFFGNLVTQFQQFISVTFDFSNDDLSRINPQTLQIYSSSDGVNWSPEQTTLDLQAKTASTSVNHLTQFALVGERLDTEAPVTQIQQSGNVFTLSATDNYSGVDYIVYKLDDGDWQEYTAQVTITPGTHTVHYYSADNHENIEEEKVSTFNVATISSLKLQYYPDPTARGESVDAILPDFNIVNIGNTSVPLKELSIRYYFTRDSEPQDMYFYCDYAKIGCYRIKGKVVTLTAPVNDTDSYIEISFTSGTLAANGQTKDILIDITREDEGNFNQTNDYSFEDRAPQFTDWSKISLYRNGQLVWGSPPN